MGKQRKIFQRPHSMSQFKKKVDSNVMVPKAELNEGDNKSSMSNGDSPLSQGVKTVQDKLNNENQDCNVEVGLVPKYIPQIDLTCDQLDVFASSLSITMRGKIMEKSEVKEPDFMNTNEYFSFTLLDRTGIINVLVRGDTIGGVYDRIKVGGIFIFQRISLVKYMQYEDVYELFLNDFSMIDNIQDDLLQSRQDYVLFLEVAEIQDVKSGKTVGNY
ncbi:hypothetical protein QAD02_007644 [Eretmocerus hayati]|uniref:Uncharacterized protein n=1 Tax=Eretmocerus hayati TaxID=131215 RepID=A0ACC2N6P1_9HYME|nr:hypothetical protein QAD02_007644 [Eretmocerus hayati]